MKIDWDLSARHTLDEVDWPKKSLDLYTTRLEPVESVRIRLPGNDVLKMTERASDVILYRRSNGPELLPPPEGDVLTEIEVYTVPLGVEDAYRRALAYADQFGLSRAPLQGWRRRRERGADDVTDRTTTAASERHLGAKDGPIPDVELLYSANEERPWVVKVALYWPPPKEGRAPSL